MYPAEWRSLLLELERWKIKMPAVSIGFLQSLGGREPRSPGSLPSPSFLRTVFSETSPGFPFPSLNLRHLVGTIGKLGRGKLGRDFL